MDVLDKSVVQHTNNEEKVIGSGGFGIVYQSLYDNKPAAVKRIPKILCKQYGDEKGLYFSRISRKLKHENIVLYYGMIRAEDFFYNIAMELCAGNLEQLIGGKYEGPSPGTVPEMMLQVAYGLQYLHSQNPIILHRDLKPTNILISKPPAANERPKMKLVDFGLCKEIDDGENSQALSNSVMGHVMGWRAPECFRTDESDDREPRYSKSSDIFSLGCVYGYAFTGGFHPFGNVSYLRPTNIINGLVDEANLRKIADPSLRSLISKMLNENALARPEIDEILDHRRFSGMFGIMIKEKLVAKYEWYTEASHSPSDIEQISLDDPSGLLVGFRLWTWEESDVPPQLKSIYLPQVKAIANFIEQNKTNETQIKQIIRNALLIDVRMPNWPFPAGESAPSPIKETFRQHLPQTHQRALVGDISVLENLSERDTRNVTLNEMFYWNSSSSLPCSDLLNNPEHDGSNPMEKNNNGDQMSIARKAIRKAWTEDRIPPAFYLAAANSSHGDFCRKAIDLLRKTDKDKLKQFTIECLFYSLYIVNDETIALACLKHTYKDFSEDEFIEMFPCSHGGDMTKEQSVFARLTMHGWFEVMTELGLEAATRSTVVDDLVSSLVSLGLYGYDVVSDVELAYNYLSTGEYWPFSLTLAFVLLPALVMTQWIARKYVKHSTDFPPTSRLHWKFRVFCLVCCVSPVACHWDDFLYGNKYLHAFDEAVEQVKNKKNNSSNNLANRVGESIKKMKCYERFWLNNKITMTMAQLIEDFLESTPQMLLQLYFMDALELRRIDAWPAQSKSLVASMLFLAWTVTSSRSTYVMNVNRKEPSWLVTLLTFISHLCWIFAGGVFINTLAPVIWLLVCVLALLFIVMYFSFSWWGLPHGYRRFLYSSISIFTYTPDMPKAQKIQVLILIAKCFLVIILPSLYDYDLFMSPLRIHCFVAGIVGAGLWRLVTKEEINLEKFGNYVVNSFKETYWLKRLGDITKQIYKVCYSSLANCCKPTEDIQNEDAESEANPIFSPERNEMNPLREFRTAVVALLVSSVSPMLYILSVLSDTYLAHVYGTSSNNEDYWNFFTLMTLGFIVGPGVLVLVVNVFFYVKHQILIKKSSLGCIFRILNFVPCISYLAWYAELADKCLTYVTARGRLSNELTTKERAGWEKKAKTAEEFLEIRGNFLVWFLIEDWFVAAPQLILQIYFKATRTSQEDDPRLIACQNLSIFTSVVIIVWAIAASNLSSLSDDDTFGKLFADKYLDTLGIGLLATLGAQLGGLAARGVFVSLIVQWLITGQFAFIVIWIAVSFELLCHFLFTLVWLSLGERAFEYHLLTYPIISLVPTFLLPEPVFRSFYSGLQP